MTPANPSHAQALVFVDELARCGVTDAVVAPGSRSAALAMALHADERIRLHVEIDERSAAFVAIGLARASGRVAPVVTTSGTAVANLHPAVIEADTGRVPLLLLTADRPAELRHTGANQAIDQIGIFGRAARWSVEVGVAEDRPDMVAFWRSTVCRAVAECLGASGPPGPVQVNLPFREPTVPVTDDGRSPAAPFTQPIEGRPDGAPWVRVERGHRAAPPLDDLVERMSETERGLIVVGQSDADPRPIRDLAWSLSWPVVAEVTSGARSGELIVGTAPHLVADPGFAAAHRPELVLRVGRTGLAARLPALLGADVPQVLIDPDGAWDDPERTIGGLVVADVDTTLTSLAWQVAERTSSAWVRSWLDADERARAAIDAVLDADDVPSEPRTARDLGACLPDGTTLVVASSMPVRDLDAFLVPRDGLRVIANRGASGIDGTVSTALGAGLATGEPIVALVGDVALLHDASGFLLAPELPDVTFVVVDNDGGGIFSFLPQAGFPDAFEAVFGTPHGRDLAGLARFHDLGYERVERAADLPGLVRAAMARGGVGFVHVRTDRAENLALHRRITAEVSRSLS